MGELKKFGKLSGVFFVDEAGSEYALVPVGKGEWDCEIDTRARTITVILGRLFINDIPLVADLGLDFTLPAGQNLKIKAEAVGAFRCSYGK